MQQLPEISSEGNFKICLIQGVDYKDHANYYQDRLYASFCLLSWLIPEFNIIIEDEIEHEEVDHLLKAKIFTTKQSRQKQLGKYVIYQRKLKLRGNNPIITYFLNFHTTDINFSQVNNNRNIQLDFSNNEASITIRIKCWPPTVFRQIFNADNLEGSFSKPNYFKPPCRNKLSTDIGSNFIEYYYLQSEKSRFYDPKCLHLSISLQGGGAKGISYAGLYQSLQEMQRKIQKESNGQVKLPIKSIIGSSVGGILAFAICSDIQQTELRNLCLMMKTLTSDLFVETEEQGQEAESSPEGRFNSERKTNLRPHHFTKQGQALKQLLNNFGLVEDSLTDMIFQTLKQPTIQDKIVKVLRAANPTYADLLTFKNQPHGEGQQINCCCSSLCCCCTCKCCKQKQQHLELINYYGLLCIAVMTGGAVQNILAYCLVLFFSNYSNNNRQDNTKLNKFYALLAKKQPDIYGKKTGLQIARLVNTQAKQVKNSYDQYIYKVNHSSVRPLTEEQKYINLPIMELAKSITMKEYYELTGIQFTCTSLDMVDKIQRFFNHKTTPNLPVCKAVQMTGSFPVAFESLKWAKEWGYYYVHYKDTRRQVNLVGHNFSDGGVLANFPLKYLDNEKFRPMYFSHKNVKGQTFLYGFGLDQQDEFPQNSSPIAINQALDALKWEFFKRMSLKILRYLCCCKCQQTYPNIQNFNVLSFLLQLSASMRQSDRNLNVECFQDCTIDTIISKKVPTKEGFITNNRTIQEKLNNFKSQIRLHFKKQYKIFLEAQCNAMKKPIKSWAEVEDFQRIFENNLNGIFSGLDRIYQQKLQQLGRKYFKKDLFFTSITQHHQEKMNKMIKEFQTVIERGHDEFIGNQNPYEIRKEEAQKNALKFIDQLKFLHNIISQKIEHLKSNQSIEKQIFMRPESVAEVLNTKSKLTPFSLNLYRQILQNSQIDTKQLNINYYAEEYCSLHYVTIKNKVRSIIQNRIKQSNNQSHKIHIIFQAFHNSHYYYPIYINIVENALSQINTNKPEGKSDLKIDVITCTDYHAFFGVLYAMGYEINKIKQQMSKIQSKFKINNRIDSQYNSKEWMKSKVQRMHELLQKQWLQKFKIFEYYEKKYGDKQQSQKDKINSIDIKTIIRQEISQQNVSFAFQKTLDYISGSFEEVKLLKKEERKSRINQLLGLGKKQKANSQSKLGKKITEHFLGFTFDLLVIIAAQIMQNQTYDYLNSGIGDNQTLFKGMVLSKLMDSLEYKSYIYQTLIDAELDTGITLHNFYCACKQKILLNFNCVKSSAQRFSLINKVTKPNMPLWAALMSAASLPYLEKQFTSRKEWEVKQAEDDLEVRQLLNYFRNHEAQGTNRNNTYISGNFISTLPIELLTNQRVISTKLSKKKHHNQQQDKEFQMIEIAFSFSPDQKDANNTGSSISEQNVDDSYKRLKQQQQQGISRSPGSEQFNQFINNTSKKLKNKKKFLNCGDICGYICEFLCSCCCSCNFTVGLGDIFDQLNTKKNLNIRMNSNDNFNYYLYYDTLIKLPLRVGTLEFSKINQVDPYLDDTIRQAKQVSRQLLDTVTYDNQTKSIKILPYCQNTTIQLSFNRCHLYNPELKINQQKQFYRFKFISYTKWRKVSAKYAIKYTEDLENIVNPQWKNVPVDFVDIPKETLVKNEYKQAFRYIYCKDNRIKKQNWIFNIEKFRKLQQMSKQNSRVTRALLTFSFRKQNQRSIPVELSFLTKSAQDARNQFSTIFKQITPSIQVYRFAPPFSSMYCTNPKCQGTRLDNVLKQSIVHNHRGDCFECGRKMELQHKNLINLNRDRNSIQNNHIQDIFQNNKILFSSRLVAMKCRACKSNYCLPCKINNFIIKQKRIMGQSNQIEFRYPMTDVEYILDYSPLPNVLENQKNTCAYCEKYSYKLWYEKDQNHKVKSGLTICQNCTMYVADKY